jgi:PAS domain S-box-containing protein
MSPWVSYPLAVMAGVFAMVLKAAIDGSGSQEMSPFILGIAAVIASAVLAGPRPAAVCTALLGIYAALDLGRHHVPLEHILIRTFGFLMEGFVLCFWAARMIESSREAASREAWHRQMVETASEGIWIRNANGVITFANARMAEMLGTDVAQITGRKADDFFFPADVSVERIRWETMSTGFKEQFDRRLRRADGSELWVLTCRNPMFGGAGEKPSALSMMSDITERKRAEQALRQSEERFRGLFESVPEGVYQTTPDGRILAANPMLLKMVGYTNEADLGNLRTQEFYADPAVRKRLLELLERDGSFQNVEYELRARDGRIFPVLGHARTVRDQSGAVSYYEGTLIDITSRKRMEEQLRQAQKVEALGRLAGGVAHDFNTVLNVIAAHIHAALRELPAQHPARSDTERALLAAGNATELTRQLLAFSKRPGEVNAEAALGLKARDGESILLVEDEPLVRELSRDMLERQGYRVTLAADAPEALRLEPGGGGEVRFDLLITDVSMPDMTGSELVKRMRSVHPGLKVLFVSGYSDPPLERDDLSGGDSAFLQKPFSADALGRKVREMLQG